MMPITDFNTKPVANPTEQPGSPTIHFTSLQNAMIRPSNQAIFDHQSISLADQTQPARSIGMVLLLLLVAALIYPQLSRADSLQNLKSLSLEALGNIEVTIAGSAPQQADDIAAAVYVISRQDISNSSATSIPELLRQVPGLHVARMDGNKWAISSRGFSSRITNKLLVMIDGRSVYSPLFGGVMWDEQDLILTDLERIEVIRGPGATIWGANAVNGVINIITRRSEDTQGNFATTTIGDNYSEIALRHGGKLGESGYFRLYAKHRNQAATPSLSGGSADDEGSDDRAGFRVDWRSNNSNEFTLQGDIYNAELSERLDALTLLTPFSTSLKDDIDIRGGNLLARWSQTSAGGGSRSLQTYLDYSQRDQYILEESRITFDLDFDQTLPQKGRHQLTWGANYRYAKDHLPDGDPTKGEARFFTPERRTDRLYSLFLQDEITLQPEHWWLSIGTKLEHNNYTGFEYQPNVRLRWRPVQGHTFWGAISRAVRTPTRAETDGLIATGLINVGPPPTVLGLLGNDDLESETVVAHELGYRFNSSDKIRIDLSLFYNRYDNLTTFEFIRAFPLPAPPGFILPFNVVLPPGITAIVLGNTSKNLAHGESYGLEASVDWHPNDRLQLKLGYSFLEMQLHNRSGSISPLAEQDEGSSPQHQLRLDLGYQFSQQTRLNLVTRFVDQLPSVGVDSYVEMDASMQYQLSPNLEVSIVGRNLLDSQHLETRPTFLPTETSEAERDFFLRFSYSF